jgi:hypothetical protein
MHAQKGKSGKRKGGVHEGDGVLDVELEAEDVETHPLARDDVGADHLEALRVLLDAPVLLPGQQLPRGVLRLDLPLPEGVGVRAVQRVHVQLVERPDDVAERLEALLGLAGEEEARDCHQLRTRQITRATSARNACGDAGDRQLDPHNFPRVEPLCLHDTPTSDCG